MHKTTIEVDEALVAQASAILGTQGLKATVARALEEVIARQARIQFVESLRAGTFDLDDPDVMASAWR